MADYLFSTSFRLGCTDEEASVLRELDGYPEDGGPAAVPSRALLKTFTPIGNDPWSGYRAFLEEQDLCHDACFNDCLFFEDGAWHFGAFDMDGQFVARVLARVCKSALPIKFTWANTCSKLWANEFGGGVAIISASQIAEWHTANAMIASGEEEVSWSITPI